MIYLSKKINPFCLKILKRFFSFFPLKDNCICLESHSDCCDSTKALFDYLICHKYNKKYKICWFVDDCSKFKNSQNVFYYPKSPSVKNIFKFIKGIYILSVSKYCFYTHIYIGSPYNKSQVRCFITHASPPVKDSTGKFEDIYFNTDILSTSDFSANYRCKTFNGGKDLVRLLGLPRNDKLFLDEKLIKSLKKKLKCEKFNKIFIWMPTFKHHKRNGRNDFNNNIEMDISLLSEKNLRKLNDYLVLSNSILFVKLHPSQNLDFINIINSDNIRFLTNDELLKLEIDVYNFLGLSDALITDFSSVYFDYLLLNRPIGFELRDMEIYNKGIGFIFDNPLDYMPGHKIKNLDDFKLFINDVVSNNDIFLDERTKLLKLNHLNCDNNSSKRVVEYFKL